MMGRSPSGVAAAEADPRAPPRRPAARATPRRDRSRGCAPPPVPALPGFHCATLTVPLHRRGPHAGDGRTLTLDVAVQRAPARAPRGDLSSSAAAPASPGCPFGPRMAQRLRRAAAGYRLVVRRPARHGRRAMRCRRCRRRVGTSDVAVPLRTRGAAPARAALGDASRRVRHRRHRRRPRRPAACAGRRRWTVAGISYGAFVAERYALAHPGRTRAVVLDSVVPQEGVELLERVPLRATARVLRTVCADAGRPCSAAGGDPVGDLRRVVAAPSRARPGAVRRPHRAQRRRAAPGPDPGRAARRRSAATSRRCGRCCAAPPASSPACPSPSTAPGCTPRRCAPTRQRSGRAAPRRRPPSAAPPSRGCGRRWPRRRRRRGRGRPRWARACWRPVGPGR